MNENDWNRSSDEMDELWTALNATRFIRPADRVFNRNLSNPNCLDGSTEKLEIFTAGDPTEKDTVSRYCIQDKGFRDFVQKLNSLVWPPRI
ncbi:MAG: hypothetical protein HY917_04815 [Candidatus Diapherotrites archaeon]|nr:hypothetical protein [Candidatus Diapherotrites archaeon]